MDSFIMLGMQFSIIASVLIVVVAYVVLALSTAIWYLAAYAKRSLLQSTSTLSAYKHNTQSVMQASKLHDHRKVA